MDQASHDAAGQHEVRGSRVRPTTHPRWAKVLKIAMCCDTLAIHIHTCGGLVTGPVRNPEDFRRS